jgi:hypothetical protein
MSTPLSQTGLPYLACLLALSCALADQHHDVYPAFSLEMLDKEGLEAW